MNKRTVVSIVIALLLISGGLFGGFYYRDKQTGVITPPASQAEITAARATAAVATPPSATEPSQPVVAPPAAGSGDPVRLMIPSLGIDIAVAPGVYNNTNRSWTLSKDKAHYAVMTPQPNATAGNTFIYGHYRKGIFSTLSAIKPGTKVIVKTDNGKTFTYIYNSRQTVSPDQADAALAVTTTPVLTIQTCTGLLLQDRLLLSFNLESVA